MVVGEEDEVFGQLKLDEPGQEFTLDLGVKNVDNKTSFSQLLLVESSRLKKKTNNKNIEEIFAPCLKKSFNGVRSNDVTSLFYFGGRSLKSFFEVASNLLAQLHFDFIHSEPPNFHKSTVYIY